jgi:hypothetical protein
MLNIIKNNKNNSKIVLSEPKKGNDMGIIRHFPANTKYWNNSIYSFNKNTVKSIPVLDSIVNNILRMYFNLKSNVNLNSVFVRKRTKIRRLSSTKIFVSKAEMKHSNDKIIINLYTYNRNKKYFIRKLRKIYRKIFGYFSMYELDNKYNDGFLLFKSRKETLIVNNVIKYIANKNKSFKSKKLEFKRSRNYRNYIKLFLHNYLTNSRSVLLNNNNLMHNKYVNISNRGSLIFNKFLCRSNSLINILKDKNLNNIISFIKNKKISILLNSKNEITFNKFNNFYYNKFIKDTLRKEMLYLRYNQLLNVDSSKFNNIYLSRLSKLIGNMYNKKIEFNIINLKYMFLDSNIFSESIVLKIRNRKNNLVKILRKAMKFQKLNLRKNYKFNIQNLYINKYNKGNINKNSRLFFNNTSKDVLNYLLSNIFNTKTIMSNTKRLDFYRSIYIYRSIRLRKIRGVKLIAKGRLTRRLTASRAILKLRYKGSLNNLDSSVNKLSSVILRNNIRSNIDYVNLNSKTRNGSFGIKGWISSR